MNVLLWFRRDLRIDDHPALANAAGQGAVLPVFVADPAEWSRPERSARQWAFVAESLTDLQGALGGLGLPLVLRRGAWQDVLATLVRAYDIGAIHTHVGRNRHEQAQDRALCDWAAARGVEVVFSDPALCVARPAPIVGLTDVAPGFLPEPRALGLQDDPCPQRQRGGRARGLRLAADVAKQLDGFHAAQKRGDPTRDAALSAHLAWGTLTAADLARVSDGATPQDRKAFLDLARIMAQDVPICETPCPEAEPWATGNTGWPFVDAAMRALRVTGTLPQAVLAHLVHVGMACELPHHVIIPHLARLMIAGELPAMDHITKPPADPARFGERADPQARFILTHVPALKGVPPGFRHRPWEWMQPEHTRRYPLPVYHPAKPQQNRHIAPKNQRIAPVDFRQNAFDFGPLVFP